MGAAVTAIVVSSLIGLGAEAYRGERQAEKAKAARKASTARTEQELVRQQNEREKLKRKQTGIAQRKISLARNVGAASKQGVASTRLTGAGGIDPSLLNLAQTTLLG